VKFVVQFVGNKLIYVLYIFIITWKLSTLVEYVFWVEGRKDIDIERERERERERETSLINTD
jgi:hypothetical protein